MTWCVLDFIKCYVPDSLFPKLKITPNSEALASQDKRKYRNVAFHNGLARQGSSFLTGHVWISKLLRCVTWKVERFVCPFSSVLTEQCLALAKVFLSMCRSSRVIYFFCFNSKTQWRMFLFLHGLLKGRNMASSYRVLFYKFGWHTSSNNANGKQQRPVSWQGCLYIHHLSYPRFLTYLLNGYNF